MIKYGNEDIPEIAYGSKDEPVTTGLLEPDFQYDPKAEHQRIVDTIDISERSEISLPVVHSNLETARQSYEKQNRAAQKIKQYPYIAAGMGGYSPWITKETAEMVPFHPVRTLAEIGKAVPRFLEQEVAGTFGGTLYDWFGQFIEEGGVALDKFSKLGAKNPDQIYNPLANAIISAGQQISAEGKKGRQFWLEQGATGWEAIDEKLRQTDPISYGAGRLTEGVASSALSVLAVYLSGGAAAPATLADKGFKINRALAVLSSMSAAGGFEHAQATGENFTWSTLHGLADGMTEYVMESKFLEGVGKGSSALTAGFKEGGEEFATGMLQNTRAGILENEKKGMSAYEGAKDAVIKALKQAPWEIAAGFIGGWGMVGGANLVNLTKKANAMPIVSAEKPAQVTPPTEVTPKIEPAGIAPGARTGLPAVEAVEKGAVQPAAAAVAAAKRPWEVDFSKFTVPSGRRGLTTRADGSVWLNESFEELGKPGGASVSKDVMQLTPEEAEEYKAAQKLPNKERYVIQQRIFKSANERYKKQAAAQPVAVEQQPRVYAVDNLLAIQKQQGQAPKGESWIEAAKEDYQAGRQKPVILDYDDNGKIYIVDGNARIQAAKELGLKEIPVEFYQEPPTAGVATAKVEILEEIKEGGKAFEQTFKISEDKSFVSFTHNRKTGETIIRNVYVPENLRRQGIGTRLVQQAISEIESKYPGTLIKTYPTTSEGKKLMSKAGFIEEIETGAWTKKAAGVATAKRPWDMTDEEFKQGGWAEFPGGEEQKILLPSEYKEIAKNEGEQARDFVYELNLNGVDTLDTHKTDKRIVIHIPPNQLEQAKPFIQKYQGQVRTEKIGNYITIPIAKAGVAAAKAGLGAEAAIRLKDGTIRTGLHHGEIYNELIQEGKLNPDKPFMDQADDGWLINGEYISTNDITKKIGVEKYQNLPIQEAIAQYKAQPAPAAEAPVAERQVWEMTREEFKKNITKIVKPQGLKRNTAIVVKGKRVAIGTNQSADAKQYEYGEDAYLEGLTETETKNALANKNIEKIPDEVGWEFLRQKFIQAAVREGRPVPRAVLEEYKSEKWAQEALGKAEAAKVEGAEPSGGVAWDTAVRTGLANAEAVIPKVKREQRKTLKQKVGAMVGTKEWLLKKGVSPQEAIWRSSGQLRGPHTDYEQRYVALDDVVEPWVIEAALADIAVNPRLGPFDPINLTNPEGTGAFDKFRRGAYLTKGEVELLKKWNDLIGQEAEKRIPWTVKLFSFLEEVMAVLKAPAGYDVQIRRNAGWIRGRHPKLYTEAIANDLVAYMSKARADALAEQTEDDPRHEDAVRHGVRFLDREHPNIEQYLGEKIVAKVPLIGPAYKAAMRGFIDSFNWVQQQLWNQKIDAWEWKGKNITDEMKNDLADFNNTILGMAKPKTAFGAMARRVLSPVMWSPTMTWSRIRTPSMLFTNATMRGEVAATLPSYIASGLLIMVAASIVGRWRGEEDVVEWDWLSVDFGKVKIGNTRFDVYVDGGPYIRALIQLAFGEKKNQAGRLRPRPRLEVVKQFVRNKRAPIFDFIGQIWTGRTYYGSEAWKVPDWQKQKEGAGLVKRGVITAAEKLTESDLGEKGFLTGREIYERFAPFFVQAQLEAMWNDGIIAGLMAGVDEFFSGQVMSYEPSTFAQAQILQDTAAMDAYKKMWEDLSPQQQDGLRAKFPQITELEIQADGEMAPADEISLTEQNRAAEEITDALPKEMRKELSAISVRISGLSRNLGKFRLNDARYETYQAYAQKEIEQALTMLFGNSSWPAMDKTKKTIYAKGRIDDAKARARERLRIEIAQGRL